MVCGLQDSAIAGFFQAEDLAVPVDNWLIKKNL